MSHPATTTDFMSSSSTSYGSTGTSSQNVDVSGLEGAKVRGSVTTQQPGWFGTSERTTNFTGTAHTVPDASGTKLIIRGNQENAAASSSSNSSSSTGSSWFGSNSNASDSSQSTGSSDSTSSSWFGSNSNASSSSQSSSSTGSSWFGSNSDSSNSSSSSGSSWFGSNSSSTTQIHPTSTLLVGSREQAAQEIITNPELRASQGIYDPYVNRIEGSSSSSDSTLSSHPSHHHRTDSNILSGSSDDKNKLNRDASTNAGGSNTEHVQGVVTITKERRDI